MTRLQAAADARALSARLGSPAISWQREYRRLAVASDVVVIALANVLGLWLRYGVISSPTELDHEATLIFRIAAFLIICGWMATTSLGGCYDDRVLGSGSEEFKRMINASVRMAAMTGFLCYLTKTDISRGYVATTLLIGASGLLGSRCLLRAYVHHLRRSGDWS